MQSITEIQAPVKSQVIEQLPKGRTIPRTNLVAISLFFFDAVSARFYGCSGLQRDISTVVARAMYEQAKTDGQRCKVVREPNGSVTAEIGYGWITLTMPAKAVA